MKRREHDISGAETAEGEIYFDEGACRDEK